MVKEYIHVTYMYTEYSFMGTIAHIYIYTHYKQSKHTNYTIPLEKKLAGRTLFPLVLCIASRITTCLPYSPTFIKQKYSYIHTCTHIYVYIHIYTHAHAGVKITSGSSENT